MDEETFNMSMRKFLKQVGVTSQQQMEKAVREGIASGRFKGNETFKVKMHLEGDMLAQPFEVDGTIKLA